MVAMFLGVVVMAFIAYMLVRNNAVADARIGFIKYFYEEDPDGYAAGKRFHDALPSYDEMLWKSGCGLCQDSTRHTEIEIATSDHAIIPSNVMGFFIGDICQKSTL